MALVILGANPTPAPLPGPPMAPFYGLPPGTDTRGMGLESFDGRGPVRKSTGATRPPTIPPEVWGTHSPKKQNKAIEEYLAQLAADAAAYAGVAAPATGVTSASAGSTNATVVASASAGPSDWQAHLLHGDDIPRLPREFETLKEPHRERNTWHPPGCIARKLS